MSNSDRNFVGQGECGLLTIHEVFQYFLDENLHTDVTFSVRNGDSSVEFSAHKLIVSLWSPVLADICYRHTDGAILIDDVTPNTFEAMLKFMYGSFSDRKLKNIPFLLKLYKAAVAYEVEALMEVCKKEFIWSTPDKNTVFQFLDAGRLLDCKILIQRCYKILADNTAEVLTAQDLCNVTPAMLMTILDLPRVSFTSEYELISWVLAWVKNEFLKDSSKKTFREVLDEFLPFLNFQKLKAEEFAKLIKDRNSDFISEQEGFSIFMNIAIPGSYPMPLWIPSGSKHRKYRNDISDSLSSMASLDQSCNSLA